MAGGALAVHFYQPGGGQVFPARIVRSGAGGQVNVPGAFGAGLAHQDVEAVDVAVGFADGPLVPHFGGRAHGVPDSGADEASQNLVVKDGVGDARVLIIGFGVGRSHVGGVCDRRGVGRRFLRPAGRQ